MEGRLRHHSGKPRFHYAHVVPALFIGFLLNTLLPARIGEIARVAVLQRRLKLVGTEVPTATIAGSVVASRSCSRSLLS